MVELTKVKTGELSDLLKTVNKGVSMYEELSRGLGNVEIVLKEALHGHKSLAVERLKRSLLEDLLEEDLAKSGGELIDKSADAEVLIGHDGALDVEHLTNLKGDSCFLICSCKVLKLLNNGGDTYKDLCAVLGLSLAENALCLSLKLLGGTAVANFLYYYYVLLADIDNVVLGSVRSDVLNDLIGSELGCALELNHDNCAVFLVAHMELVGLDIDIVGENVVTDDVLNERALVILLVVEALDVTKRNSKDLRGLIRILVLAFYEDDAIVFDIVARYNELVGEAVDDYSIAGEGKLLLDALSGLSDLGELTACYYNTVLVDSANGATYDILHLMNYRLEQAVGHKN